MIEAYAVPGVYACEAAAAAQLAEGELMARAVEGLVAVARARLAATGGRQVVALVGPGNNGADALYAVARLAADGVPCGAVHLETVHAGAYAAARAAGVVLVESGGEAAALIAEGDLVLDGIVGIGGRPGLPDWARAWVEAIAADAYVIAVDLPSGQDPSGRHADPAGVFADETVTFSLLKPVHLLPATEAACGLLTVVDIGLNPADGAGEPVVRRLDRGDVRALWRVPGPTDDKYSRGVVGIISGGENYSGAAVLACTAAVSAGAGMVRYVGTPTPEALVRAVVPEVVIGAGRVQAWVIGPGLDVTSRARGVKAQLDVAREVLAGGEAVVVDAGGLDLIDGPRSGPTLLTPHAGEAARLLSRLGGGVVGPDGSGGPDGSDAVEVTRAQVEADPLGSAQRLAALTGAAVLLKGATTIVVEADAAYSQNDAPAWLATAGAGDVLAGLLGALVASGLPLAEAGAVGALVHGVAADDANPGGPVRALAVAEAIPGTVARLLRAG
ncbi:bifunctional ADP-dependent NAD(P)H-hydrate dehydratase/NAD(P)H-hydrate epimerase [Nostocoides jenkinsii]|uniref:ADP-dependent (S)-NAD(P)H-hydrate dehydratase n=1 Tax=Nostocoides jenkinsii Ben 74 TaxID=1193518 RepID=A0A077M4Z4_9MICO|nr:bifunctional ADP-dependent NAD(P)H-hydrate dehydratase/NAD(P)H-hydrate epimerase [Tetrasphaera jenkinsii]CCI51644.1 conserved hypothetical protein [Tetrasphaera jenkinsii Ben 74]